MIHLSSAAILFLALLSGGAAIAQSSEDIVNALDWKTGISAKPGIRKPNFGATEPGITDDPTCRGIKIVNADSSCTPPSIDLAVPFEFNSDKLTPDGIIILRRLGDALKNPRLTSDRFKIAGHTDAKGTPEYNQKLSERRAQAVRDYLVFQYDVEPAKLETVGYGLTQLADPAHPEDAINRRVQVVNVGSGK